MIPLQAVHALPSIRFGSQFTLKYPSQPALYSAPEYDAFLVSRPDLRVGTVRSDLVFLCERSEKIVEGVRDTIKNALDPKFPKHRVVFYGRYTFNRLDIVVPDSLDAVVREALAEQRKQQHLSRFCYVDPIEESHAGITLKTKTPMIEAIKRINGHTGYEKNTPRHFRAMDSGGKALRSVAA